MKKYILVIVLLFVTKSVTAASGKKTLTIEFVGSTSSDHPITVVQSVTSFGFNSDIQLGTCPLVDGKVYFENSSDDKGLASTILAAKISGKDVQVYWDDSIVTSRNICKIINVRVY